MADRIFGILIVVLAGAIALLAQGIDAPFSYEPVGPKAWPTVLAVLLATTGVSLVVRAIDAAEPPVFPRGALAGQVFAMVAVIIAYAIIFQPLGFTLSTWLLTIALGRIFGGAWWKVIVAGAVMGVGLYYGFDRLLDVTLANGPFGLGVI